MKIEVLVSTMHQGDHSLVKKMNLKSDSVIINQCDEEKTDHIDLEGHTVQFISTTERGLSKSRNMAIRHSSADICVVADDDLVYVDDYVEIINKVYDECADADIIAFDVPSDNDERPTNRLNKCDVSYLSSMKLASFQLTFKRKSLVDNDIHFNEYFGAGSKHFTNGEENILLIEALKKNLKIKYADIKIATVSHQESTWFNGFDEKLFRTKGAMFYNMSRLFYVPLVYQYAFRKRKLYSSNISFFQAIKLMNEGKKEYIKLLDR